MKTSKIKILAFLLLLVILLTGNRSLVAQTYKDLIEQATIASGNDALLLNEFKIKQTRVKKSNPFQVSKSSVWLEKGLLYRINTANSTEYDGEAIVQLFDKKKLQGSTYDIEKKQDRGSFDFLCLKSSYYQVLMSFKEGKPGYAVAVLSLLVTDSTTIRSLDTDADTNNLDILYIGIDNPISISASNVPERKLEVSINKGKIIEKEDGLYARVNEKGLVSLRVVSRDSTGKVRAIGSNDFYVKDIPLPYITIANKRGGTISATELLSVKGLLLEYLIDKGEKYEIRNFKISHTLGDAQGKESIGDFFSPQQKQFIRSLQSGDKLFIYDIVVKRGANGKEVKLEGLEFVVE